MSRRLEPGSMILTPRDANILYQAAHLGELRNRYRVGDNATYQLLADISACAFSIADPGNLPRQSAASEERETWTVHQVAKAAGLSDRTVRLDCQNGDLPAMKQGQSWLITAAEATTYITRRKH